MGKKKRKKKKLLLRKRGGEKWKGGKGHPVFSIYVA